MTKLKQMKLIGIVICVVIFGTFSFGLLQAPFVGAQYIIDNPIEFLFGWVSDLFEIDELQNNDIYELSYKYYERNENIKSVVDQVIEEYDQEAKGVTVRNIVIPFVIYQYRVVTYEDVKVVADWLNEYCYEEYDEFAYVEFISSTKIFKDKRNSLGYDKSYVEKFVFSDIRGEVEYDTSSSDLYVPGLSELGNDIALKGLEKLGYRYWWGAPGGGFGDGQKLDSAEAMYFDCSGFVAWSHRQVGVNIPRLTASGYSKRGVSIKYEDLQAGDVITFSWDGNTVDHIGIYIGNGSFVHASGSGSSTRGQYSKQCVKVSSLKKGGYYYNHIHNMRRLY